MNIPLDKIQWKKVNYLRKGESLDYEYSFWMNEPLASWDVFDYWERARIHSMQEHLIEGDIFFDIGTEQGWCNLAYAQIVGPENMVLIEPTREFWPNIKALWKKNYSVEPMITIDSLVGAVNKGKSTICYRGFGEKSEGDLIDKNSYTYIHDNARQASIITIDKIVKETGVTPRALNIDVEGAELEVLKGAKKTLKNNNIKIWISVHNDLALRDYGVDEYAVHDFLIECGYDGHLLAEDHEKHFYYYKQ